MLIGAHDNDLGKPRANFIAFPSPNPRFTLLFSTSSFATLRI